MMIFNSISLNVIKPNLKIIISRILNKKKLILIEFYKLIYIIE